MKKEKTILFQFTAFSLLIAFVSFSNISAQKAMVKGYIRDNESLEPLPYAAIYLPETKTGIPANQYGYYTLVVQQGMTDIQASFAGYETIRLSVYLKNDTTIDFYLKSPSLTEVVVTASKSDYPVTRINATAIPMAKVKELPPFLGEYDLIKALALTPGVNTSGEGSTGLIVRGGTPDQNLILLDGATVYNNSHIFGFISTFNPEAISSADLIKGGFPPKYGGRLSSILNVTMKEGNLRERKTSISVGPLSSQFTTEGPVVKEKASYIVSGRATYLTLLTLPLYLFSDDKSDKFNFLMYDLNAKVNFSFNEREKMFLSFYSGRDNWNTRSNESVKYTGVDMSWNNTTASMRYTRDFRSGLFSVTQAVYNRFKFRYMITDESLTDPPEYEKARALTSSSVEDVSIRQNFEIAAGIRNKIETGMELSRQVFHPDYYKLENINLGPDMPKSRDNNHSFFSGSAYLEDNYSPFKWLSASAGLRYAMQFLKDTTYSSLEPRLSLLFKDNNKTEFSISYTFMAQPVFQLTNTGQGLPIDVWVPVTKDIPSARASQWSVGLQTEFGKWPVSLQAELYYKTLKGLIEYNQGVSFVTNISHSWYDNIVRNGIGKSYGFELLIGKESGSINGWLGYTFSRNYRKFDAINKGQWYFARYDRTHDLELTATFHLKKKWKMSGVFALTTGQPATLATTVHEDIFGNKIQVFTARNNLRMPSYHRLDLSFSKEITLKKTATEGVLSFGAYNVYNRLNPFYVTLDQTSVKDKNGQVSGYKSRYNSGTLLGIVPFINYSIKF